jgi:hypothetical protein
MKNDNKLGRAVCLNRFAAGYRIAPGEDHHVCRA